MESEQARTERKLQAASAALSFSQSLTLAILISPFQAFWSFLSFPFLLLSPVIILYYNSSASTSWATINLFFFFFSSQLANGGNVGTVVMRPDNASVAGNRYGNEKSETLEQNPTTHKVNPCLVDGAVNDAVQQSLLNIKCQNSSSQLNIYGCNKKQLTGDI